MKEELDIFEVINYVTVAHNGQVRKTTGIPKISHLYGVGMLLKNYGCNDSIVKAGLLHDVVEDCEGYTLNTIEEKYGKEIMDIVKEVSEKNKKLPWKERKLSHIEHIKNGSYAAKMVTAADKIHNLFSLKEDLKVFGDSLWDKFNAPKDEVKWYYKEMYYAVIENEDKSLPIFEQYKSILMEMKIL